MPDTSDAIRLILTTLPDAGAAGRMARDLVESRLAACVNVMPPCRSCYRWQDNVQEDEEIPVFIKTTAKLYPAVEAYLQQHHPYDLPEIIALDVAAGLPEYLRWVADATAAA